MRRDERDARPLLRRPPPSESRRRECAPGSAASESSSSDAGATRVMRPWGLHVARTGPYSLQSLAHETRTVRDGTDAIHLREPGGVQSVRKRRPPAAARRAGGRRRLARRLADEALRYTQSNGTLPLRSAIAAMYPGATADHVQVTNGGSEANYITTWNLVEPGDEVVMMVPNYMQTWGLARAFGATVSDWPLVERRPADGASIPTRSSASSRRGQADHHLQSEQPDRRAVRRRRSRSHCVDRGRHGTWILSDEIYRGAELDGRETPSMWGRHDRVIVTSGLSKAYALAGPAHRLGRGAAAARRVVVVVPRLHDDFARRVERRARPPRARAGAPRGILARTRAHPEPELPDHGASGCDAHGGLFSYVPPDAGAIVYVRYRTRSIPPSWSPGCGRRRAC